MIVSFVRRSYTPAFLFSITSGVIDAGFGFASS